MRAGRRIVNAVRLYTGFDLPRTAATLGRLPHFAQDLSQYARHRSSGETIPLRIRDLKPVLGDAGHSAGTIGGDYFHQDLWAARKIFGRRPSKHIDVGSRIDGFVAHVLTFMPVVVLDIRPVASDIEGLEFRQTDATFLKEFEDDSVESLSSLHAVEHFGLGRYGDPIAPDACFNAMRSFARVLAPNGRLYFSTPIGRERVEFNAQRVFSPQTILRTFSALSLVSFSAVDGDGALHSDVSPDAFTDIRIGCGLFEFTKG